MTDSYHPCSCPYCDYCQRFRGLNQPNLRHQLQIQRMVLLAAVAVLVLGCLAIAWGIVGRGKM